MKNVTIYKAKASLESVGQGVLILNDTGIAWSKAASLFRAFGSAAPAADHVELPFTEQAQVDTYSEKGMIFTRNDGKEYKFTFNRKSDFNLVNEYLLHRFYLACGEDIFE